MSNKPHMNLVVIGHVDHGKSTLVGRLMLDTGQFPQHMIDAFKKEAAEKGKGSFFLAWVMDNLKEERERGVTIDVAHKKFDTDKYYFTIIDAPGHRDFVKNMITGASQADAAILTCSAIEGPQAQTKEHVFLSKTLGIDQLVVAVNKMDAVDFSQEKFNAACEGVKKLTKLIGFKEEKVRFVPVSAFAGVNIKNKAPEMAWYTGPTLLEAIDQFEMPNKPTDKPLRVPIQDVYSITGIGTVPVGKVETGILKPGQQIHFNPSDKSAEVKSIEMHHEQLPQAGPGDNCGFNCRGLGKNDIRRGDVGASPDNKAKVARTFTAQVIVLNHPSVITVGYTPVFHAYTAQTACQFEEIVKVIRGGKEVENTFMKTGDQGVVKIRPTKPMVVEKASEFPPLGRFAIRDMGQTVAVGVAVDVEAR